MSTRPANSTLADLPHQTEYRSDCHDLVRDFDLPCLERSSGYRRAVGCFTSCGLSLAAHGNTVLIQGRRHMLVLARGLLDADNRKAIMKSCGARTG